MDNLRRLEVWYHDCLVGYLALTNDYLCIFEYAGGFHTTSINDSITPKDSDLIALAVKAGLDQKKAVLVLEEMREEL